MAKICAISLSLASAISGHSFTTASRPKRTKQLMWSKGIDTEESDNQWIDA